MIGTTHTIRRIATGLTLAALVAALGVPAAASTKAVPDVFERYASAHPLGADPQSRKAVPDVFERYAAAHPFGADPQSRQVYQHSYGQGDARLSQATSQVYQHAYGESDARLSRQATVQRGYRLITDTLDSARVARYGPPDPWLYPYINSGKAPSLAATYSLPNGFATDTLETARVAQIAASGESARRLYLGMNLHFTGPDASAGTFVASGAVADSGTVAVEHTAIVPIAGSDRGTLSGVETYSGQLGTIVTRFEGVAFPLSSPHEVGLGTFEVVSGSGAYVGLSGQGVFEIVVDATSNQLIGTETASVRQ